MVGFGLRSFSREVRQHGEKDNLIVGFGIFMGFAENNTSLILKTTDPTKCTGVNSYSPKQNPLELGHVMPCAAVLYCQANLLIRLTAAL